MTVTVKTLVPPKQMEAVQTTQYTATAAKALIDKATVTNTDTVNRTFSVNLVQVGDVAGNANLIIDDRTVVPGETYLCPELVGQDVWHAHRRSHVPGLVRIRPGRVHATREVGNGNGDRNRGRLRGAHRAEQRHF